MGRASTTEWHALLPVKKRRQRESYQMQWSVASLLVHLGFASFIYRSNSGGWAAVPQGWLDSLPASIDYPSLPAVSSLAYDPYTRFESSVVRQLKDAISNGLCDKRDYARGNMELMIRPAGLRFLWLNLQVGHTNPRAGCSQNTRAP